jgi:hypothetical protein
MNRPPTSSAQTGVIQSARELARLVGRSHSSVLAWLDRSDWPFASSAPWPREFLPEIVTWANALADQPRREASEVATVKVPGRFVVATAHVMDARNAASPIPQLGMFANFVTHADYVELAKLLTTVIVTNMIDTGQTGHADAILSDASPAYYERLFNLICTEPSTRKRLEDQMNNAAAWWGEKCLTAAGVWEEYCGEQTQSAAAAAASSNGKRATRRRGKVGRRNKSNGTGCQPRA